MRLKKRTFSLFLTLLLLSLWLVPAASAAGVDQNHETKLDIVYAYGGTPVSNAQISIYRVGGLHSNGTASLIDPFNTYPMDASLLFSQPQQAAKLLYSYILLNGTNPDWILTTDADGKAREELGVGLYLIAPQKLNNHSGIFRSEPALISLPFRSSANESWAYQVTYAPKCAFTPKSLVGTLDLYVTKQWQDDVEATRPREITVCLLRDNVVVDRVTLNAGNRWLHQWNALSEYYDWRVVEQPVPGYTVTVDGNLSSVLLTNTGEGPIVEPDETEPTETTEPKETTAPTETTETTETTEATEGTEATETTEPTKNTEPAKPTEKPGKPATPSRPSRPKLPQTGVLWWPVPVLLFLGIALLFFGVRSAEFGEKAFNRLLILIGLCLMIAGAALIGYNLWDNHRAEDSAQQTVTALNLTVPKETEPEIMEPEVSAAPEMPSPEKEQIPPHELNPQLEMPEKEIKGIAYIGILEIPDLNLELPIASQWNSSTAKSAPCRYYGSVYQNNMVVAGHNYQKHFGKLPALPMGTEIRFTDMEGNLFLYETAGLETIQATDIEGMCRNDWDLTLFTCTVGGHARSAVRCQRLENT